MSTPDTAHLYRAKGHTMQFYAAGHDFARWIETYLPSEFAPYSYLWTTSTKLRPRQWVHELHQAGIPDGLESFQKTVCLIDMIRLRSHVLTPKLDLPPADGWTLERLAGHGLVGLDLPFEMRKNNGAPYIWSCRISVATKI